VNGPGFHLVTYPMTNRDPFPSGKADAA